MKSTDLERAERIVTSLRTCERRLHDFELRDRRQLATPACAVVYKDMDLAGPEIDAAVQVTLRRLREQLRAALQELGVEYVSETLGSTTEEAKP
jgi:hypothetical protein